jgi:hypothetical protein
MRGRQKGTNGWRWPSVAGEATNTRIAGLSRTTGTRAARSERIEFVNEAPRLESHATNDANVA